MNEPACFGMHDKSIPKNCYHKIGDDKKLVEHRDVHSTYGYFNSKATYFSLKERSKGNIRPFVLTRSFFCGTQKYAAMWSGDCISNWDHF